MKTKYIISRQSSKGCDNVLFITQVHQCSLQDKIRLTHL